MKEDLDNLVAKVVSLQEEIVTLKREVFSFFF